MTTAVSSPRYSYAPVDPSAAPEVLVITLAPSPDANLDLQAAALHAQSLQSWRWAIVCPDAPGAGLRALCADPRVTVVPSGTTTGEAARDLVVETPCAFICVFGAATTIAPTFLEQAAWLLGTNPQIACCNAHAVDPDGQDWPYGFEQRERFLEMNLAGATALFRREALLATGLPLPATDAEAWELWLRLAEHGQWGFTIPESLIVYERLDHAVPFQPVDPPASTMLRERLRSRYGQLRGRFPGYGPADVQPFETIHDAAPIANPILRPAHATRILILMPWLVVGGAERVNRDLITYLARAGYEISIAATLTGQQHPWLAEFGRVTPDIFILDHFLRLPDFPRFLGYLIRSRHISTVFVSNSYLGYQLLPYMRAHFPDLTCIDFLHSYDERWKNGGYPRASIGYQSQLDLTIVSGDHVRRRMVEKGADLSRIEVCYTNVDTDRWRPDATRRAETRTALGLHPDDMLVIFTGRLTGEKRPQLLAPIIAALRRRTHARFLALVLGDGPERGQVERQIRALGVDDVMRTLGRVGDDDIFGYLAAADVFLLPSQTEGISVATFEAMAMGVIPVSADVGGQGELITADCGFLVAHGPHEVEEYAAILSRLAGDLALRQRMSAMARERVERHFALRDFGPRMAALIERAGQLRCESPRTAIPLALAREWATQVIEYTRHEIALDALWNEREQWRASNVELPLMQLLRQRALRFARPWLARPYRWGIAHGMGWLRPLKERLFAAARQRGW